MNRRQLIKSAAALSACSTLSPFNLLAFENSSSDPLTLNKQAFDKALKSHPELIAFQGIENEYAWQEMVIEGKLPIDIKGALYRNGPARLERGLQRYNHLFEGDGMIQGFYFDNGRLFHQGKFVKTNKYEKEQSAGRFLFSGPDSQIKNGLPVSGPDSINTSNTSVLPVNGKLWGLWEAGSPMELDAKSLDSKGFIDLGKNSKYAEKLKGMAFSAHPKVSPNGDIWSIGYSYTGHVVLYHINAKGITQNVSMIKTDFRAGMLHDFLITDKHILLILPSLVADRSKGGLFGSISYDNTKAMDVLVIDKQSLTLKKRFEIDPGFAFHYGNAWEEKDGTIHFDASLYENSEVLAYLSNLMKGQIVQEPFSARTVLFTLKPNGTFSRVNMKGESEFPRVHDKLAGMRTDWLYSVGSVNTDLWSDGVTALNTATGEKQQFIYGDDFLVEEHIVVSKSSKETDGYLLGTATHVPSKRTCLNIFKLGKINDGPVCRAWLPYHLPIGFHGNFMYAS